jgi:hypothetical protein
MMHQSSEMADEHRWRGRNPAVRFVRIQVTDDHGLLPHWVNVLQRDPDKDTINAKSMSNNSEDEPWAQCCGTHVCNRSIHAMRRRRPGYYR